MKNIEKLIQKDKLEKAIEILLLEELGDKKEVILLSGRLNRLNEDLKEGTTYKEDYYVERSRIRKSILNLLSLLGDVEKFEGKALIIEYTFQNRYGEIPNKEEKINTLFENLSKNKSWEVRRIQNPNRIKLRAVLSSFMSNPQPNQIAFVYYSGLMIEKNEKSFLVPFDADLSEPMYVEEECLPVTFPELEKFEKSFNIFCGDNYSGDFFERVWTEESTLFETNFPSLPKRHLAIFSSKRNKGSINHRNLTAENTQYFFNSLAQARSFAALDSLIDNLH